MNTSNRFASATTRFLLVSGVAASSVLAMSLPTLAHAATYAYVNQAMEVRTVEAPNWMTAISTAPGIDEHSGVLLLNSQNANIVGNRI